MTTYANLLEEARIEIDLWKRAAAREAARCPAQSITEIAVDELHLPDHRALSRFLSGDIAKTPGQAAKVRTLLTAWWAMRQGLREAELAALDDATFIRRFHASGLCSHRPGRKAARLEARLASIVPNTQPNTQRELEAAE
jgi:hypothetical protein